MIWGICCGPYIDLGMFDSSAPIMLSTEIIRREYAASHNGETCELNAEDFAVEDLSLSLNDFARKQGWIS